jgi:hypothetical protein
LPVDDRQHAAPDAAFGGHGTGTARNVL